MDFLEQTQQVAGMPCNGLMSVCQLYWLPTANGGRAHRTTSTLSLIAG